MYQNQNETILDSTEKVQTTNLIDLDRGILPVETITQSLTNGWWLPGQGKPYLSCGEFKSYEVCLSVDKHPDGLAQVKKVHSCCFRMSCPTCMEKAITRAADRVVHRLTAYAELYPECGDPIHVTISPPQARAQKYDLVRRKAARLARAAGISAAVMIYHPWRENKRTKSWRFSPHFHLIGFGWVQNAGVIYRRHGWVTKNIGVRKDVFKVVRYQLSHCGVHKTRHSITYIGGLSGRRFKAPPMPKKTSTCPVCGDFMFPGRCLDDVNLLDSRPAGFYGVAASSWVMVMHGRGREADGGNDRAELDSIYEDLRNQF